LYLGFITTSFRDVLVVWIWTGGAHNLSKPDEGSQQSNMPPAKLRIPYGGGAPSSRPEVDMNRDKVVMMIVIYSCQSESCFCQMTTKRCLTRRIQWISPPFWQTDRETDRSFITDTRLLSVPIHCKSCEEATVKAKCFGKRRGRPNPMR